ncbi:hypothetical protein BX661DRAFT_183735 [Kickxella alabastrina]|uniref:uncharacterized protein n=1 Tax=Kickxella alabastrina TaxID=61397 RepID=UPI00222085CB|nr:uncharacterized protein BX661DRAFT_183735 [Kickxella alabastrina]KAI7826276.1 hypothetical protein BX661DRAFT_183735 [Kickxella alabastrina]
MLRRFASAHTRVLFNHCQHQVLRPQQTTTTTTTHAQRLFSSNSPANLDKEIETITDLATTAKDEMEYAEESRNSVYYNEDKMTAHEAVDELTSAYNDLLERISDADKNIMRAGLECIQSAYEIMSLNDLED